MGYVVLGFQPALIEFDTPSYVVLPLRVGCSKFRYKSDIKSARIQLVKLLIFNTLYCKIVL